MLIFKYQHLQEGSIERGTSITSQPSADETFSLYHMREVSKLRP
jgi:hypothetical protein